MFPVPKALCRYTKRKSKHNQKPYFQIQPSVKINTSSRTVPHSVPSKPPGSGPSTFTPLNPIPSPTNRAESNENNADRNTLHYFHHPQKPASTSARQTPSANTECGLEAISYVIGISRTYPYFISATHTHGFHFCPVNFFVSINLLTSNRTMTTCGCQSLGQQTVEHTTIQQRNPSPHVGSYVGRHM